MRRYGCLTLLLMLCACTSFTPAQRTLWALNIYEHEYDRYLETVIDPAIPIEQKDILKADPELIKPAQINPNLTDETKKMLRVKKEILVELKPLVLVAGEYQITGKLPDDDILNQLTKLIDKLIILSEEK